MKTFDHTVQATSGSAAAVTRSTPVGHRHHLAGGDRDLRRVPAAGQQRAHLVADGEALDALAERGDGAAALEADHARRPGRRRVVALALEQVGAVDRGGGDVEHDLAGRRARGRAAR